MQWVTCGLQSPLDTGSNAIPTALTMCLFGKSFDFLELLSLPLKNGTIKLTPFPGFIVSFKQKNSGKEQHTVPGMV